MKVTADIERPIVKNIILARIFNDIEAIHERLANANLSAYDYLQRSLRSTNVFDDKEFQRRFNGFYRMRQRKREWYDYFYLTLENVKFDREITFEGILRRTFENMGRVEPSFSSKMLATVRPDMAVYDSYLRDNLSIIVPKQFQRPEIRIDGFIAAYDQLQERMLELIGDPRFNELRTRFDLCLPKYSHFTDMKKMDLILWQMR